MNDVTRVHRAVEAGNPQPSDQFLPLVYAELRALAVSKMARQPAGLTLQPTALVHEAWLKLAGNLGLSWRYRRGFGSFPELRLDRL